MADSRIYLVTDADESTLIRATSKAQAVRHFVAARVTAEVATQNDIVDAVTKGGKVLDATVDGAD